MGDAGTVEQVAFARWGVRPALAHPRFAEAGWAYEEPVARPCPVCAGTLYSLRKPYVKAGKSYRYVALVCPACPASFTLADLGAKTYGHVATPTRPAPAATVGPADQSRPRRPRLPVSAEAGRRAQILRFWRSVELFGAPALKWPDPREWRFAPRAGQPLPWQDGHRLREKRLGEEKVWRHTVYGGVFGLDRMHAVLEQVFGPSGVDVDERSPRGDSALFAVVVTEDGRLLLDSLVLSTAAWAVGRARRPGPTAPDWLDDFDAAAQRHSVAVAEAVAAADDDAVAAALADDGVAVSRPITHEALLALVALTAEHLGVTDLLHPSGVRVHSETVNRKRAHDAQVDFLNSFFVDDLQKVADAVAAGDCGPALAAYLTGDEALPTAARVDVRDRAADDVILAHLAPVRVPAGRWPAKTAHPLATSQQLAINVIAEELSERAGVFGVNGPPGTGKTTMLRDLTAAQVVARAGRLADLPTPGAAFGDEILAWQTDKYRRRIRPLLAELTGFEMVIASANNGAVANVTTEIPQLKAIDEQWHEDAAYLAEHASRVLGAPAWGLIAAVLGKRANRGEFVGRFWHGNTADRTKKAGEEGPGFLDWLKDREVSALAANWTSAVAAFRAALAAEQSLRQARQTAHEALRCLPDLLHAHNDAQSALAAATAGRHRADTAARVADDAAATAAQAAHAARELRREHRAAKPGVWEILFTLGRAIRRWHAEDQPLAAALTAADTAAAATTTDATRARHLAAQAANRLAAATAHRDHAQRALTQARATVDDAHRQWGDQVPDAAWRGDDERRELAGPWLDEAWNDARTRVFLAALDLHTAFLAATAKTMRSNLHAAMDVLAGQAPADAPEPAVRAAWQSLFLVVPVVSTTFASVSRLLGPLGREALGWLLVDEAGQAAPQMAVGALWRAKRLVAVGDPLQLEPILTVLHTTQQALRRHHNVADTWLPGRTSVQTLADRITPIGTWLPGPDDADVWVGAPLRVHRRCDNPMFAVVNDAVYAGLMIHGTGARRDPLAVTDSAWIDITDADADGNWIPAEGHAALQVLHYLTGRGVAPADILAISPFRDTERNLRRLLAEPFPDLVCGTVHLVQGKEAEVVLLVLGGNPARPGSRAWAAQRPNLFNVAVSRAKQRLYVVGNHDSWAKLRYFSTLARTLPVRPLKIPTA